MQKSLKITHAFVERVVLAWTSIFSSIATKSVRRREGVLNKWRMHSEPFQWREEGSVFLLPTIYSVINNVQTSGCKWLSQRWRSSAGSVISTGTNVVAFSSAVQFGIFKLSCVGETETRQPQFLTFVSAHTGYLTLTRIFLLKSISRSWKV